MVDDTEPMSKLGSSTNIFYSREDSFRLSIILNLYHLLIWVNFMINWSETLSYKSFSFFKNYIYNYFLYRSYSFWVQNRDGNAGNACVTANRDVYHSFIYHNFLSCSQTLDPYDSDKMACEFLAQFHHQTFSVNQQLAFKFQEKILLLTVKELEGTCRILCCFILLPLKGLNNKCFLFIQ